MFRRVLELWLTGSLAAVAAAAPYSIFYSGDDFPENEGWTRAVFDEPGGPGAVRSLNDGIFTIDSTRSDQIADIYHVTRPINPETGETFVAEWRMRVRQQSGLPTGMLVIASDDAWMLSLSVSHTALHSDFEHWSVNFAANEYHTFAVVSSNMRSYDLLIDGQYVRSGSFFFARLVESEVAWGDHIQAGGSLSVLDWDYVAIHTVPEPGATAIPLFVLLIMFSRRLQ